MERKRRMEKNNEEQVQKTAGSNMKKNVNITNICQEWKKSIHLVASEQNDIVKW